MSPERVALLLLLCLGCAAERPAPRPPAAARRTPKAEPRREVPPRPRLEVKTATRAAPALVEPDLAERAITPPPTEPVQSCAEARPSPRARAAGMIWPVDGVVVAAFGKREGHPHDGIDIAAPKGTPIWAADDGVVLFAGERAGYGKLVLVEHDGDRLTVYAHNLDNCVREGQRVDRGAVVALIGRTGDALAPAVHFEVRVGQRPENPRKHLPHED